MYVPCDGDSALKVDRGGKVVALFKPGGVVQLGDDQQYGAVQGKETVGVRDSVCQGYDPVPDVAALSKGLVMGQYETPNEEKAQDIDIGGIVEYSINLENDECIKSAQGDDSESTKVPSTSNTFPD